MPLEGLSRPQVMDALKRAFKGQELDLSRAGDGDDGQPQHIGELAREMKKELKKVGGELDGGMRSLGNLLQRQQHQWQ